MLIKVCLNGGRGRDEHPALPFTPAELAQAARAAVDAGAGAVHMHPRNARGAQSLAADDVAAAVAAVRAACPGVPVGGTTIDMIEPDVTKRVALLRSWTVLPDFVSVNFSEHGTRDVCDALLQKGVGIEAGLANADDVRLLLSLGLADTCVRLMFEPDEQHVAEALENVRAMETLLDAAHVQTPRLLHGFEHSAWPLLDIALQRGYDTRIGFEDTLFMPDGSRAPSNAALVAAARERVKSS
ncbi:MAG TPA: 3-keto-5-aminohexanoate cleavage protein [Roseiflexaceae bacterium]|jgi:uncharacterized protein (DUF849 family)|nr:3-keto-5-aminohexanoate cleavage protein [Roseiflexaceae bacterium]